MRATNAEAPAARAWRAVLLALPLACAALLSGCGTQAIQVSEAAITDRPDARVTGWGADEAPRLVFSPEDEEVTIKVRFAFNYRAVYEWYTIEWLGPDGSPYQVVSRRTDFGSHRDLQASLALRGKMASRMPGLWRVRVWLQGRDGAPDRLLVARLFRILTREEAGIATALSRVDPPPASGHRPLAGPAPPASDTAPEPVAGVGPAPVATPSAPRPAVQPTSAGAQAPPPAESEDPLPGGLLPPSEALLLESAPAPVTPPPVTAAPGPLSPPAQGGAASPEAPPAQGAAASPEATPVQGAAADPEATPPPDAEGVASVTVESRPAPPGAARRPAPRWRGDGCPPLYYPPGPGCVEQAPEE